MTTVRWGTMAGALAVRVAGAALLVVTTACADPAAVAQRPSPVATTVDARGEGGRDPLRPRITVRQLGSASAGGAARFEIVHENYGGDGRSEVDFGDNSGTIGSQGYDMGCGGPRPGAGPGSEVLTHAYRYPGKWTVRVTFTPICADQDLPPYEGTGVITVQPGRALSNGPSLPLRGNGGSPFVCDKADSPYGEPDPPRRAIQCFPEWGDDDGYVTKVVLEWGDGSPDTVFRYPLSKCVDPPDHWPATHVDDEKPPWGVEHLYPKYGKYRAYVTVTSSGCDGKDVQTVTESTRVVVK